MMGTAAACALRPAGRADWPLLQAWARQPDIQAWWGPQAAIEAEIAIVMDDPSGIARIIEVGGRPIGYAHAADASRWAGALPRDLPAGTWDIDILIASVQHRSKGFGSAAVQMMVKEVFASTLAVAVCVFVSIRNESAVRAYEKAGFRWRRIWDDPALGRCWMMLIERPRAVARDEPAKR